MVIAIRDKAQVTIPKFAIAELGIHPGDKFEVEIKDGNILLVPVAVYPKKYIAELKSEVARAQHEKSSPDFSSIDEMFNHLEAA